jgi:hypothetical protein
MQKRSEKMLSHFSRINGREKLLPEQGPNMQEPKPSSWLNTLAEVELAIAGCLESLAHYEARFQQYLQGDSRPSQLQPILVRADQARADQATLQRSQLDAMELEQLINEQTRVWQEWQESLASWQRSVEQVAGEKKPAE